MTKVIGCLIVLVGLAFTQVAKADVAAFCDTCELNSEFKTFAKNMSYGQGEGTEIYVVMNSQKDIVRQVAVTKELDVGGYITLATVSNVSTNDFSYYLSVKAAFSNPEYVVTMPPTSNGTGGESFLSWRPETVYPAIFAQPWVNSQLAKQTSFGA